MKLRLLIGLLLPFLCTCAQNPKHTLSKYKIPKPLGLISDYENNFSAQEQESLSSIVKSFEIETGIEIAIATFDTTMVAKKDFLDFTLAVANNWGVGEKHENNGILIGFSKGYRLIRINNGYGVEKLISDDETAEIMNKHFITNFKKNMYFEGTIKGTNALIDLLRKKLLK